MADERFLTSDEAAEYLRISKAYLWQLTHKHKIPFYKVRGRQLLFSVNELDAYIRAGKVEVETDQKNKEWWKNKIT